MTRASGQRASSVPAPRPTRVMTPRSTTTSTTSSRRLEGSTARIPLKMTSSEAACGMLFGTGEYHKSPADTTPFCLGVLERRAERRVDRSTGPPPHGRGGVLSRGRYRAVAIAREPSLEDDGRVLARVPRAARAPLG